MKEPDPLRLTFSHQAGCLDLALFLPLKRDLRACDTRCRKKLEALETESGAKLASLEERCNELAQISNALVPPAPTRSGLNLNKRSLALQMFRRGEPPQEISGALSIPRNEAQLLIKVQQIVMSGVGAPV